MVLNLKTLAHKGCKIAAAIKVFYGFFFFVHSVYTSFPPTSHLISNFLRFLEFLMKYNGKKWSQVWKLLSIQGKKSPRKNQSVFQQILPYRQDFFGIGVFSIRIGPEILWFHTIFLYIHFLNNLVRIWKKWL